MYLKVIKCNGSVAVHGEMVDSSGYLFVVIVTLVHNFGISTISDLKMWVDIIERDINFMTVTKHAFHIRECLRMCKEVGLYARRFHAIADDMSAEDPDAEPVIVTEGMKRRKAMLQTLGILAPETEEDEETKSSPVYGSEKFELSPSTMEPFLGEVGIRVISFLMDGNHLYEVQGSLFWCAQLDAIEKRLESLQEKYTDKLDEKRNFWSFILTIVSILQFPIAAMTGYWGMGFIGQDELDGYTEFPGIQFFWFATGIIYAVIIGYLLHSRVVLAAS
jgi:hypothetical protein